MTRVDEFNNFYSSTSATALKATYAVCGDRQVAYDATVDAYRRAWRDWTKIRNHNPLGWVRNEAWKLTSLSRSTHPLRRRHEEDADGELLEALQELQVDHRRLIVLLTLGQSDLEEASREVGVPAQQGIEAVTASLGTLEARLGQSLGEIEERMNGLGSVTRQFEMPPSDVVRRRAQTGRRRNTVLLVATALLMVIGGGFVVTEGDALETAAVPHREKIGSEGPDLVLQAQKIGTDDLLTMDQVKRLDPEGTWRVVDTNDDTQSTTPYATCPTKRFANGDPLRAFVRTYEAGGEANDRVAQAIEVSRSPEQAEDAYQRLVRWYSDCEHPRVQLVGSYVVQRPFGDFRILRLRSHRSPERTFTVGFSHSGTVTSTLVHEVDGPTGPDIDEFALTLNDSVKQVCTESGGKCTDDIEVVSTDPPRTSEAPAFLGIVDLPPIADIDKVWVGSRAEGGRNPAATQCDSANFTGKKVRVSSRVSSCSSMRTNCPTVSVSPRRSAASTPTTTRRTSSRRSTSEMTDCPDDNLSANIDQENRPSTPARPGGSGSRSTRSRASTTAWPSCAAALTSHR